MENRFFRLSWHALNRMESRNISPEKLAEIMKCGQVYSNGNGRYRAKLLQRTGKSEICYEAVFSKQDKIIISVWETTTPVNRTDDEDKSKCYAKTKVYKQRKRALREREFDSWCREEYGAYNLPFPA